MKKQGHEMFYFDANTDPNVETLRERFFAFNPEFIGYSITQPDRDTVAGFIPAVREKFPNRIPAG